jgi:hypothetical protein
MKTVSEKEKKLSFALNKLRSLNLENPTLKNSLKNLSDQKNQLEIEKKLLEEKYQNLTIKNFYCHVKMVKRSILKNF